MSVTVPPVVSAPETVTIEVPADLGEAVGAEAFPRWALGTLVLNAVGDGTLSTGRAAELLGIGDFAVLALLKAQEIPMRMTEEEIAFELAEMRRVSEHRREEHRREERRGE